MNTRPYRTVLFVEASLVEVLTSSHPCPEMMVIVGFGRSPKQSRQDAQRQMRRIYGYNRFLDLVVEITLRGKVEVCRDVWNERCSDTFYVRLWRSGRHLTALKMLKPYLS